MARVTLKLAKPIDKLELDIDENELEALGYVKVIHCDECEHADKHNHCNRVFWWNNEHDYCSRAGFRRNPEDAYREDFGGSNE